MNIILSDIDCIINKECPEMSIEGKHLLCELLTKAELKKGDILYNEGDICSDIVLVTKGMLRQFYFKNNKDITEHFSYEGSVLICIESFLKQEPTKLMAEALESSTVYLLSYNKLKRYIEQFSEINKFYRKILEYSLIISQQKADSMRYESAVERYNKLLNKQPEVIKRAPLSYIASYLLMTPETLSRVRSQIT
jgi:CRP-like cAMP-binding protein